MPLYGDELNIALEAIAQLTPVEGDLLRYGVNGWEAVRLTEYDVPLLDASRIETGRLHRQRVPWDEAEYIGYTTPSPAIFSDLTVQKSLNGVARTYIRNTSDSVCGAELCLATGPGLEQSVLLTAYRYIYARLNNESGGPLVITHGITVNGAFHPSGGVAIGSSAPDPGANNLRVQGLTFLGNFTVATVPSAIASAGAMIYVADEELGGTPAFSDGQSWRRIHDRGVIG